MKLPWGKLFESHISKYDKHVFTRHHSCVLVEPRVHIYVLLLEHLIYPLKQRIYCTSELDLSSIATVVLNNARPWGLFLWTAAGCIACNWEMFNTINCGNADAQSHDINYLASLPGAEEVLVVQISKIWMHPSCHEGLYLQPQSTQPSERSLMWGGLTTVVLYACTTLQRGQR